MERMTNEPQLREEIAKAIWSARYGGCDYATDTFDRERDELREWYEAQADAALATLGLDDLDAAVERGARELYELETRGRWSHALKYQRARSRQHFTLALRAALNLEGGGIASEGGPANPREVNDGRAPVLREAAHSATEGTDDGR
jgi:hypothetical protein